MVKQTFIVQYSRPTKNRIAVSDWLEYTTKILAYTFKDALAKFNKTKKGTWYILDCYPEQGNLKDTKRGF